MAVQADGYYAIIPEWVLDAEIGAQAIRLYAVLRRYADHRTLLATPSRRILAGRLHVADVKVVDRALAELDRIGAVTVTRRRTAAGDRDSNGYRVHTLPWGRGPEATTPDLGTLTDLDTAEGGGGPNATTPGREREGVGVQTPQPRGANATTGGGANATAKEPQPEEPQPTTTTPPLPLGLPASNGNGRRPQPAGRFEEFWAAYPKKVGKDAARRAWDKAARRADPDKIIDVVQHYPWRSERQFIKDPATWLNAGCWEDDLDAVAAMNGSGRGSAPRPGSLSAPLPPRGTHTYGDGKF